MRTEHPGYAPVVMEDLGYDENPNWALHLVWGRPRIAMQACRAKGRTMFGHHVSIIIKRLLFISQTQGNGDEALGEGQISAVLKGDVRHYWDTSLP
jgi:hypothetical protein